MRAKLSAALLALTVLSAPLAMTTPTYAATAAEQTVLAQCKIGPTECKAAVKLFIANNAKAPDVQALVISLVKVLSTDTTIPGANISAGVEQVVAETKATSGGALVGVFNETQLTALADIKAAVDTAGTAIQTAALPPRFSTN